MAPSAPTASDGRTRLADETDGHDPLIYLKVAFDAEPEWHRRLSELASAEGLEAFLTASAARAPFYRELFHRGPVPFHRIPLTARADHDRDISRFLTVPREARDLRLRAATNGTVAPQMYVQFDPAAWYDFNYGTFAAVARAVPGLLERMLPKEVGVVLITNALYQPHASTFVPTLNCAILRQLVIGRGAHDDRAVVEYLCGLHLPLLYGKPSNLLELARLCDAAERAGAIRPHAVLVSGERLYADQRQALECAFGCGVFDAYIATEAGLIAIECPQQGGLHVRGDAVRVELRLPDGRMADEGAGQIVVTSLFNRAHVFVRYQLGDDCEIVRGTCRCGFAGQTITTIRGRDAERFESDGRVIDAASLERFLTTLPLREFQLWQRGRARPLLKWVPAHRDAESVAGINGQIHAWLRDQALDAHVVPLPLDWITPRGGKLRRYVRIDA